MGVKYTAYESAWILSTLLYLDRVSQSLPPKETPSLCLPS